MFLYAAPAKGSGKSLLGETTAVLAGAEAIPSSVLPMDEAEIDKLLVSVLRAGSPVLWLDNVTGTINAAALCRLLTSETYEARVLGRSERRVLWGCGVNLGLVKRQVAGRFR